MEQKKVQRTIGILVVIALVIVVMPLLFGKNNFPIQEAANIKAPPFPDQPQSATEPPKQEVASADADLPKPPVLSSEPNDKQSVEVTPEIAKKVNDDSQAAATKSTSTNDNKPAPAVGTIIYEPASVSTETTPSSASASSSLPATASSPAAIQPSTPATTSAASVTEESKKPIEQQVTPEVPVVIPPVAQVKPVHPKSAKILHAKAKTISPNDKIKSSGWVVQMGNFAVKKNAVHLANTLQAAGYKVFTKEIKNSKGNVYTRVYIGPELKQASATQISNEIHHKLNLQGFVISYAKA